MKRAARAIVSAGLAALLTFATPDVIKLADIAVTSTVASAAAAPKTPSASLKEGTYTVYAPKTVKLSCGTKGATIYYKLDSGKYRKYVSPITLGKNCTLSFYAEKNGAKSSVVTKKYKLVSPVDISIPTGSYPVNVTFNTIADDITLYYTTDGSKPTKSSAKVKDGKLTIKKSCTLRVLAVKSGWTSKYYKVSVTAEKDELKPSILDDYTNKFLYNTLNDNEKEFYRRLYDGVMNYDEKIDLEDLGITKDRATMLQIYVRCENPELFRCYDISVFTSDNKPIYAVPKYTITDRTLEQKRSAQLREIADDYLAGVKKLSTDFERALYIYDRVTNEVTYSSSFLEGNKPYSKVAGADNALIDHDAICLGYAQAIAYLCQYAGIPCFTEISPGHAWNRINIGGSWYALDATWDDNSENINYHNFFLNTNDEFMVNHSEVIDKNTLVTAARSDSSEYTYLSGMGITRYTTAEQVKYMGMKYVANELAGGKTDITVYYKNGLGDKLRSDFDSAKKILASYGVVNTLKSYGIYDDHAVLHFNVIDTRAAAADAISNGLKNGARKFTINFENSVIKNKADLQKLFTENGIIVAGMSATVGENYARITVTPYTKKSTLDSDGMKKARESLRSGAESLLFIYTDKVYEDNMGLVMLKSLNSHGICSKTISGLAEKTYTSISLTAYGSGDDLMKNGFANAAKSACNGVSDLLFFYNKGLKSSMDGHILQSLTANGIITKSVLGYVGDEKTSFSLLPYETVKEVKNYGIPNAATAARNGCKQLTIWYDNGLKSSVRSAIKDNFAALMQNNGANVTVKSMNFFDDHVLITLN